MNRLEQLRARAAELDDQMNTIMALVEGGEKLSKAQRAQWDALLADAGEVRAEIDRIADTQNFQSWGHESAGRVAGGMEQPGAEPDEAEAFGRATATMPALNTPPAGRSYRDLFCRGEQRTLDRGGFRNFDEFLSAVHGDRADGRLQIMASMGEDIDSGGGYAVPEDFGAWMMDKSLELEIVRPRAQVWPMTTETRKVPGWDANDHSTGALFGGFTGQWLAENATATESDGKLRLLKLKAKKYAVYGKISNELREDGLSFEQQLTQALVKTTAWGSDDAYFNGTGAGMPLGILKDRALIVVSKETGQLADTITYENLVAMFARVAPQCLPNAVWIASQTTIPTLLTLGVIVGLGGTHYPVLKEDNGQFSMLGKPVFFTEKVPALGNEGDLLLVDLSQYAIGLRREITLDQSNAPGWLQDQSSYRAILRVDGQGTWNKVITPKNGDTLSWCVTLAARA